jgi:hypothetical protein
MRIFHCDSCAHPVFFETPGARIAAMFTRVIPVLNNLLSTQVIEKLRFVHESVVAPRERWLASDELDDQSTTSTAKIA